MKKQGSNEVSQIVNLVTAVIFLLATIISIVGELPWWLIVLAVLLFIGSASPTLYQKTRARVQWRRLEVQENKLVQKHWGELRKLVIELHQVTEGGRIDALSVISDMAGKIVPNKPDCYYPYDSKYALSVITDTFLLILDAKIKDKRVFISSVQLLGHLMRFWHDLSMRMAKNLIKDLETSQYKLNSYEKQNYNTVRKRHTDIMDKYVEFTKTIALDFSNENVWDLYHEPLPDL